MFAPLGALPAGVIGVEAVGEVEAANPTGFLNPDIVARTAGVAAG